MIKATNNQIQTFRDTASMYLKDKKNTTKFSYALDKLLKKLKTFHEQFIDDAADLRTDKASIDPETKILLKDTDGSFKYTIENEKELRKALRALGNKLIDIEPHFVDATAIPKDLSYSYEGNDKKTYAVSDYVVRTAFTGFVLKEEEFVEPETTTKTE